MKLKLSGVYKYTFTSIKKELSMRVKHDNFYKESLNDLIEIFINLEENKLDITSDFTDSKAYAKSIAESLTLKKYPYLIKNSLIVVSTIITLFILFTITTLAVTLKINLDSPYIEYNNQVISWNQIENASSYTVSINNDTYIVNDTSFEFIPPQYGLYQIIVYANKPGFFYQKSKFSNQINYIVSEIEPIEPISIYPYNIYQVETNIIGDSIIRFNVVHGGQYELNFSNINSTELPIYEIINTNSLAKINLSENQYYNLQPYITYELKFKYLRNSSFSFSLSPKVISLENLITIEPFTRYFYTVNTPMNSNQYITLLDYQNDIYINNIVSSYQGYPGIPYGTLSWENPQFEVLNQTSMPKEYQLIKKTATTLSFESKHTITEQNQVEVIRIFSEYMYKMLYVEYDSNYYDIYFMDEHLSQLSYVKLESSLDYISIPLVHLFSVRNIYAILVPKENKEQNSTTIKFNYIKPNTGTYWPLP